jgi:aspartate/methionine/tyrosine aminotransferase
MTNRVAKRMTTISPSLTLAISAKAKAMKAAGESVVSFGVGEPDFNTPEHIINAAKTALDNGHTKYTPSSGLMPLRKAICEKLNFASLEFQSLEGVIKAIGINPENLCTYCWNGKE